MVELDEENNLVMNLKDSGGRPDGSLRNNVYELDEDRYAGFVRASRNNQTTLALEYAVHLVTDLSNQIYYLNEQVKELKLAQSKLESKPTPTKKPVKKPAPKTTPEVATSDSSTEASEDSKTA
jgi:hypothetical protein